MKKYIIKIGLLLVLFSLISCATKVNFTKEELKSFNVYEENDILVFENLKTNEIDTSIIIQKKIYHDWQLFANSDYNIPFAVLHYSNSSLKKVNGLNQHDMINLSKSKPSSVVKQTITYLNSTFLINKDAHLLHESLILTQNSFGNIYKLGFNEKHSYYLSKKDENNPEFLFWDATFGIIKYITFKGEIWERTNW